MSIKVMSWVWDHGPEQQSHRFVLLALADFANDEGECWPSIEAIMRKVCMTDRGVQKVIRQLEAEGWISTVIGSGRKGCNQYRISTVNPERRSPFSAQNPERGSPFRAAKTPNDVPPERRSPRTTVQETPNDVHHPPERRSPEPSLNLQDPSEEVRAPAQPFDVPDRSSEQNRFPEFWAAYPRKEARLDAEAEFITATIRTDAETVIAGARAYAARSAGQEQRFVTLPGKWLAKQRWTDEASATPAADPDREARLRRHRQIARRFDAAASPPTPLTRIDP